ncbi:MAG TPA: hypothetical protein ENJ01_04450 [Gammaproteobacteria bacterium]|nr:hypothetical protein [Gammaproteobacteria bacterium]
MKKNQLTKGENRRIMYIENKDGEIDGAGAGARVGWVTFSKSGLTVYYRDKTLLRIKGGGKKGNYLDEKTGEEYWISGVKKRDSNAHQAKSVQVVIDEDAVEEYERLLKY